MELYCKGFLETWLTFETLRWSIPLLFSFVIYECLPAVKPKSDSRRWEIRIHASYSGKLMLYSKTLRRSESVICSYLLRLVWHHSHFKLHRLTPRSSIHSLKIQMTSHSCNKYEHTLLSYLLSVKRQILGIFGWSIFANVRCSLCSFTWKHHEVLTKQ